MKIKVRKKFGWGFYQKNDIKIWFSGYLTDEKNIDSIFHDAGVFLDEGNVNIESLSKWIQKFHGHFALIVQFTEELCFASVDRICSIPIYTSINSSKGIVSNHAPYLKDALEVSEISQKASVEIAMSGFSIGNKTIYKNIQRLSAGECFVWSNGGMSNYYYYTYYPDNLYSFNNEQLKKKLSQVILSTLKDTIKSVNDRQIVIPLSAGNDSRLIASGLKHLGYENVICFAYGRRGNYEVSTSKEVASILGYKWVYIQDRIREKRRFLKSSVFKEYVDVFESYSSIPNIQEIYEIYILKQQKSIDDDAVIINGNSGDFISGGHVPNKHRKGVISSLVSEFDWSLFLNKHYSLWKSLRTKVNDNIISSELLKNISIRCNIGSQDKIHYYAFMECMECIGRQSRIVINQQRSYEFIGHEWRLPFWNERFFDFWERVPVEYKINQKLYKDTLIDNNWGGVWKNIEVNNKLIRPYSLWLIRWVVKLLISPFGRKVWHRIEKNVFSYWMHPTYIRTVTSYFNTLFDFRGHRGANSWLAMQLLKRHGFSNILNLNNFKKNKIKE